MGGWLAGGRASERELRALFRAKARAGRRSRLLRNDVFAAARVLRDDRIKGALLQASIRRAR